MEVEYALAGVRAENKGLDWVECVDAQAVTPPARKIIWCNQGCSACLRAARERRMGELACGEAKGYNSGEEVISTSLVFVVVDKSRKQLMVRSSGGESVLSGSSHGAGLAEMEAS